MVPLGLPVQPTVIPLEEDDEELLEPEEDEEEELEEGMQEFNNTVTP